MSRDGIGKRRDGNKVRFFHEYLNYDIKLYSNCTSRSAINSVDSVKHKMSFTKSASGTVRFSEL